MNSCHRYAPMLALLGFVPLPLQVASPPPSLAAADRGIRPIVAPEAASSREMPADALPELRMRDLLTGTESTFPLNLPARTREWRPDRPAATASIEPRARSFDTNLVAVTSAQYPWSTQCRIVAEDAAGNQWGCSGTLIDPRHVITAAHCLHGGPGGTWMSRITVYPAWDGDEHAFGAAEGTRLAAFSEWTDYGSLDGDMGLIQLDRPVGYLTGVLGFGYDTSTQFYLQNTFNLAGLPAGSTCYPGVPDQLYYGYGFYDVATAYRLLADVFWTCPTGGMSGAGSYWIEPSSGGRYVMGVHSHRDSSTTPNWVGHTRLSPDKFDAFVGSVMPTAYSRSKPDYVPLAVRASGSRIQVNAGQIVTGVQVLVVNSSEYDPGGNDAVDVGVYLSGNENISALDTLLSVQSFALDLGPHQGALLSFDVVIPAATPTGTYHLGVLLDASDADPGNNSSDGWDALKVDVQGCQPVFTAFGQGFAGSGGVVPLLSASGGSCRSGGYHVHITQGRGGASGLLWASVAATDLFPVFGGGHLYVQLGAAHIPLPIHLQGLGGAPGAGNLTLPGLDLSAYPGLVLHLQAMLADPGAARGVAMTQGVTLAVVP